MLGAGAVLFSAEAEAIASGGIVLTPMKRASDLAIEKVFHNTE
jgi:hypothetical protein